MFISHSFKGKQINEYDKILINDVLQADSNDFFNRIINNGH
jgi:hypothetical protein